MNIIKTFTDKPCWKCVPVLEVSTYSWGGDYRPKVTAQIAYQAQKGFWVRMTCWETDPLTRYHEPNKPVCTDSCMEFFANFSPTPENDGEFAKYINFEANSAGALLSEFGTLNQRTFLLDLGYQNPEITPFHTEETWGYELFVSNDLIHDLYGINDFASGDTIKANFFKCGDHTAVAHYASWQPISFPYPSFHRPQFFAELTVE